MENDGPAALRQRLKKAKSTVANIRKDKVSNATNRRSPNVTRCVVISLATVATFLTVFAKLSFFLVPAPKTATTKTKPTIKPDISVVSPVQKSDPNEANTTSEPIESPQKIVVSKLYGKTIPEVREIIGAEGDLHQYSNGNAMMELEGPSGSASTFIWYRKNNGLYRCRSWKFTDADGYNPWDAVTGEVYIVPRNHSRHFVVIKCDRRGNAWEIEVNTFSNLSENPQITYGPYDEAGRRRFSHTFPDGWQKDAQICTIRYVGVNDQAIQRLIREPQTITLDLK